jgi:hypothetical protein
VSIVSFLRRFGRFTVGTDFFSSKKSIDLDLTQMEVNEVACPDVWSNLYSVNLNGWRCFLRGTKGATSMRFLTGPAAEVYLPSSNKSREAWEKDLEKFESLPAHPNVTRYLFHEVVKSRYVLSLIWPRSMSVCHHIPANFVRLAMQAASLHDILSTVPARSH